MDNVLDKEKLLKIIKATYTVNIKETHVEVDLVFENLADALLPYFKTKAMSYDEFKKKIEGTHLENENGIETYYRYYLMGTNN